MTAVGTGGGRVSAAEADDRPLRLWPPRDGHLVAIGASGSVVMMAASWWVGATPAAWGDLLPVLGNLLFYVGLAALTVSWLLLGRRVLAGTVGAAVPRRFALAGAAPFVIAAPMGRDLWAYAAQGHLLTRGLDPYRFGPDSAPGEFARQVSPRWRDAPAPYGPIWLRASQAAAWVSHNHPVIAVLLLRLPAFVGLALCCWALPVLVERLGGRLAPGLWVGVASPLMLVLGVGGGHNDLVMLGLALAGLAVATRPGSGRLAVGAGIGALAVLVKSPAAIVVAFTVPVSLAVSPVPVTTRRTLAAIGSAVLGSGAVLLAGTVAGGLGLGWTRAVSSDPRWVSWLSLPSGLTMLGKFLTGSDAPRGLDDTLRASRTVGEVVAVALLVVLWLAALRRPRSVLPLLAAALGVAALLGPSVQPWYYLWTLVLAGLVVTRRRAVLGLAVVAVVFPIMNRPSGIGLESSWAALPVIAFAVLLVWTFLGRRSPLGPRRPAHVAGR